MTNQVPGSAPATTASDPASAGSMKMEFYHLVAMSDSVVGGKLTLSQGNGGLVTLGPSKVLLPLDAEFVTQ